MGTSRQLIIEPIGIVRSPFGEKSEAPRQATAPTGLNAQGTIELLPQYEDALSDLEGFDRIWILFWFDRAEGWRSKVQPPRSEEKRGLFATRSPHRPNPIGMSSVRLERIEGRVLHVRDLDLIDQTPVIDLKPYIRYADAFPDASAGWLDQPVGDPLAEWKVVFEPRAEEALAWILRETTIDFRERISSALELGPQPHAYRRIKEIEDGRRLLAVKEWRARFRVDETARTLIVEAVGTGYRPRDLAEGTEPAHAIHRAFSAAFPM